MQHTENTLCHVKETWRTLQKNKILAEVCSTLLKQHNTDDYFCMWPES